MSQQRFSRPAYKSFVEALHKSSGTAHASNWNLYSDFLELSFIAMSQPVRKWLTGEIDAKREARYMEIVKRYPNPGAFAEALGIVVLGLEEEPHDFLGNVAGELGLLEGEWSGQFFTPKPVCDLMVQMNLAEEEKPDPEHRLMICEPACGAGAMALSVASFLKDRGFHPSNWWLEAIDKDRRMFHAAYIQLSLCGVPGIVRNADALSLEQWDAELTLAGAMFPLRREAEKEYEPAVILPTADQFQLEIA